MSRAPFLLLVVVVASCDSRTSVPERVFACVSSADCAEGWSCVSNVCAQGTGTAGGSAGSSTAGGGTAGGGTAAGSTAGGSTAGGGTAGGGTAGGSAAGGAADGGWWDTRFAHRRRITVTTGAAPISAGYALPVSLDHAALVATSSSRADGNDVRVACVSGSTWTELDRVLDTGSSFGAAGTRLWFRFPTALGAFGSDSRCFVHYEFGAAGAAPAAPSNVFLFHDDFETGTLAKWTKNATDGGHWQTSMGQAHRGQWSLEHTGEQSNNRVIYASPALNVADVYFDLWWRMSSTDVDVAQHVRGSPSQNYEADLEGTSGWNIAKRISNSWSELAPNRSLPVANTWIRIGVGIYGTRLRVFRDGAQINPASGQFDVGSEIASGNVGMNKWYVDPGESVFLDDAVARPWVDPEPTTALGPEEP